MNLFRKLALATGVMTYGLFIASPGFAQNNPKLSDAEALSGKAFDTAYINNLLNFDRLYNHTLI